MSNGKIINTVQSLLKEGCLRYGIDPANLIALNKSNITSLDPSTRPVYQYQEGGVDYTIKFTKFQKDQITPYLEIVAFVDYLAERGIRVCRPLPSLNHRLVETISFEDGIVVVFKTRKVAGEHVIGTSDKVNDPFFREWGRTVGQLHAAAKAYNGGQHIDNWKDEIDALGVLTEDDGVRARWNEIGAALQVLPQPTDAYGLIHNDLHPENFLLDQDKITVLDFDVCHRHWFILDIAMAVYSVGSGLIRSPDISQQGEAFVRHCFETFMAGYETENHLDSFWIHQMPLFLSHRLILPYLLYEKGMIERKDPLQENWRKVILDRFQLIRPEVWLEY